MTERYWIDEEPETIEEFHLALKEHQEQAPDHGTQCICMDRLTGFIRKHLGLTYIDYSREDFVEWLESDENKIQDRIRHIVGMVIRNR